MSTVYLDGPITGRFDVTHRPWGGELLTGGEGAAHNQSDEDKTARRNKSHFLHLSNIPAGINT